MKTGKGKPSQSWGSEQRSGVVAKKTNPGSEVSNSFDLFIKDDGKFKWFDCDTTAFTGETLKEWEALEDLKAKIKAQQLKFERAFYGSMQKAAKAGKLNGFPALSIGVNKAYAISYGYKWDKFSVSFDPSKQYVPGKDPASKAKFSV